MRLHFSKHSRTLSTSHAPVLILCGEELIAHLAKVGSSDYSPQSWIVEDIIIIYYLTV